MNVIGVRVEKFEPLPATTLMYLCTVKDVDVGKKSS